MKVNGNNFEVVGVYGARVEPDTPSAYQTDNFMIVFPTPLPGCWGIRPPQNFLVKAKDDASMNNRHHRDRRVPLRRGRSAVWAAIRCRRKATGRIIRTSS